MRESVLEAQARACRLPLLKVPLPDPCSDEQYQAATKEAIKEARGWEVATIAFGDLFLADVRDYRERRLAGTGTAPVFPLWGRSTSQLVLEMIDAGLEVVITCVDTEHRSTARSSAVFSIGSSLKTYLRQPSLR